MQLDYPQKQNGMFILNRKQIDEIAQMVLAKYAPDIIQWPTPLDIGTLAQEDFCLNVLDKHMNRDYLGLTAFGDISLKCYNLEEQPEVINLAEGTVILNASLLADN